MCPYSYYVFLKMTLSDQKKQLEILEERLLKISQYL